VRVKNAYNWEAVIQQDGAVELLLQVLQPKID
jgi:hypothetical protein